MEKYLMQINLGHELAPTVKIIDKKLFMEGNKEQFQTIYDMLVDQFDFNLDESED